MSLQDHAESFYAASLKIIQGVARRELDENTEGVAALFLCRHYLELALKGVLETGRSLTEDGHNDDAPKPTERIHILKRLWNLVLRDANPKIKIGWDRYDVDIRKTRLRECGLCS